ncbi:unnamed protein product, partial [Ectocarpus sp. 4 AP-2014]
PAHQHIYLRAIGHRRPIPRQPLSPTAFSENTRGRPFLSFLTSSGIRPSNKEKAAIFGDNHPGPRVFVASVELSAPRAVSRRAVVRHGNGAFALQTAWVACAAA